MASNPAQADRGTRWFLPADAGRAVTPPFRLGRICRCPGQCELECAGHPGVDCAELAAGRLPLVARGRSALAYAVTGALSGGPTPHPELSVLSRTVDVCDTGGGTRR